MIRLSRWFDDNILFILSGFLLAFIPLFPKLPLTEILPGYIVRIRLEDVFIAFTLFVWLIQLLRRKIKLFPNPLLTPIAAYLLIAILSMLSAVFLIKSVPFELLHIGKMGLHFLRRIEYFSLFFVFYSAIKSTKQVKTYLIILLLTILSVTIYGYGQKYFYWYAYSTMNREFSKGWALVLTDHARVLSTFGGHYDLAAYAMSALTLMWAAFFGFKKKLYQILMFVCIAATFWILILTASRTSFLGYLAGVTIVFFLYMFRYGLRWSFIRWASVIALSVIFMLSFGDLSERFLKLLKLDARIKGIQSLLLNPVRAPPTNSNIAMLENNTSAVTSKSDMPPTPVVRPVDVENDIPDGYVATISATGEATVSAVQRTYSQNAVVYDLSTGIRLDVLWPNAIKGLKKNPLLGSGYSTLNKVQVTDFTEAESTDNDYLRALGETGILGFLAFAWILLTVVYLIWKTFLKIKDPLMFALLIALVAIVGALLTNAVYIDIFESSKVALSFWALVGIVLGALKVLPQSNEKIAYRFPTFWESVSWLSNVTARIIFSHKTHLILVVLLAYSVRQYRINTPLADWHSWRQADTSAVTRNYVRYGINMLIPRYDDLSSVASGKPNPQGYRMVEFPIYNVASVVTDKLVPGYSVEHSGRLTSILCSLGSLVLLYSLMKRYFGHRVAWFAAFFFAVLPYNIYWSRVILPEPMLVFLCLGMLTFFDRWIHSDKKRYYVISLLFAISALLIKVTAIFFAFPMIYLVFKKWGFSAFKKPLVWFYPLAMIAPFFWWRGHIAQYPEGIPAYEWLFNGNGIRFKGAFFWWLFAERISKLILGGWGVAILIAGIIYRKVDPLKKSSTYLFHWWLLGMIAYLVVFATGNVQHDYYQVILVPILCVFLALGLEFLLTLRSDTTYQWIGRFTAIICVAFILMFGWYQARDLFNINHPEIVEAGNEFDRTLGDKKGTVIAPYGGDTAFLYQTGHPGWPLMEGSIDDMILKGAHYYVSANNDDLTKELITIVNDHTDFKHQFKILKQSDKVTIIQLVPDSLLPKN